ncbi:MAG: sulfotransferase, partial [Betaproteobacteria bacterium]
GFERWGLKEVRLSIEHAAYLKWLFPRAKFLFLIRDPHACYRSFLRLKVTYVRWPDQPVDSPESYGRHWVDLAQGFVDRAQEVGGVVVRYEALCAPDFDAEAIDRYLGFALDLGAREFGVSSSGNPPAPADERERLQAVVGPLAERLGYPS